jgi:hypothetical protein
MHIWCKLDKIYLHQYQTHRPKEKQSHNISATIRSKLCSKPTNQHNVMKPICVIGYTILKIDSNLSRFNEIQNIIDPKYLILVYVPNYLASFPSLGVTPFCPFRVEMKLRGWKFVFQHFLIYSYMEKQSARLKILVFRSSQVIGMILTSLWVISRRWGGYKHGWKLTIIRWSYIRLCFVISYIKPVSQH